MGWKVPESDGRRGKREARNGCNVELQSWDIRNAITGMATPPNGISSVDYSIRPLRPSKEGK